MLDHESDSETEEIGFIDKYDAVGKKIGKNEAVNVQIKKTQSASQVGFTGIPDSGLSGQSSPQPRSHYGKRSGYASTSRLDSRVAAPNVPIYLDKRQMRLSS